MNQAPELQPTVLHEMDTTKEEAYRLRQQLSDEIHSFGEALADLNQKARTAKATADQFSPQIADQLAEQVTKEIGQAVAELQRRIKLCLRGWDNDSSTHALNDSKE